MRHGNRRLDLLLAFGAASFILLPWYRLESGFFGLDWFGDFPFTESAAPGVLQLLGHGRLWLLGVVLFFGLGFAARFIVDPMRRGAFFAAAGAAGLVYLCLQGLAVGFSGWTWGISEALFRTAVRRANPPWVPVPSPWLSSSSSCSPSVSSSAE